MASALDQLKEGDAQVAVSLRRDEAEDVKSLDRSFQWNAWKRHHWPLDVVVPGIRLYGFDKMARRFCVLLEVVKGGAFTYRTRAEFVRSVKRLTGWTPQLDDPHYGLPTLPGRTKRHYGLAIRWKVIKRLHLPWNGRFPQLGWLRLPGDHDERRLVDVDDLTFEANEGAQHLAEHLRRERNRTLVTQKRRQVLGRTGKLDCEACGFDFATAYPSLGVGFAEVHHRTPLSRRGRRRTSLDDLAILCSNCHRMIHKTKPFLSVRSFGRLINGA